MSSVWGPATPVVDVARSLVEHGIGGLPVVDDDKVLGAVSRSDLTRLRAEPGLLESPGGPASEILMSAPAATVHAVDSIALTGRTMVERRVGRLPVADEEARLIRTIPGRDPLRVFVRPDSGLRDEIIDEVMVRAWWLDPAGLTVSVHEGVVTLRGRLEHDADTSVAVAMAARVNEVVAVMSDLASRRAHTPG
ncbi:CBS domain-containing protein [Streptomyces scopuliridis]|uniref:CBS domain-containing protein n=1 Tax=Streptomyces scopuliridis TaxID=452529 RepID=UPI0036C0A50D